MKKRIKLLQDLPVGEEHGMVKGRKLDVIRESGGVRGGVRWYVMGDDGEEVGILVREAVRVKDD